MALLIPIHIIEDEEGVKNVQDKYCFLLGANGVFIKKENVVFKVIQPYFSDDSKPNLPGLEEIDQEAFVLLPQMPVKFIKTFLDFFIWCKEEYDSEGFLYLYYNPSTKKYSVIPAEQEVTAGSVEYGTMPNPPKDFIVVGTMHSHGNMGAFHSGTDHKDQTEMDGIHITVGKINSEPEFDVKLYVNGTSYKVKEESIISPKPSAKLHFPEEWKGYVKKPVRTYTPGRSGGNAIYSSSTEKRDLESTHSVVYGGLRAAFAKMVNTVETFPGKKYKEYESVSKTTFLYDPDSKEVSIFPWGEEDKLKIRMALKDWNKKNKTQKIDWLVTTSFKINGINHGKTGAVVNKESKKDTYDKAKEPFSPEEAMFNYFGMGDYE